MIYDIDKNSYNSAFDIYGELLTQAYDIDKNPLLDIDPPTPILQQIKVMSYNVGSWTAFGGKATASNQETWYTLQNLILSTEQDDLLGIQEYYSAIGSYSVPTMIRQYYNYLYAVDWVSTKAGRAIASKYAMTNTREVNFQNQNGEVRSYLIGDVAIGGKVVKFITAHLALDNATIALQIQELLSAISNYEYWILTGDFNINFPNAQSDGYNILIKPFLDAGYHVANGSNFGFIPTFSTKQPGDDSDWRYLDNIMCCPNINITNVYTDKKKLTDHVGYSIDHLPLIAELSMYIPSYTVSRTLTGCTINNESSTIGINESYQATITADTGYILDTVVILMGGTDITGTAYSNGVINIRSVTGDIVITAVAVESIAIVKWSYKSGRTLSTDDGFTITEIGDVTKDFDVNTGMYIKVNNDSSRIGVAPTGYTVIKKGYFEIVFIPVSIGNIAQASVRLSDGTSGPTFGVYKLNGYKFIYRTGQNANSVVGEVTLNQEYSIRVEYDQQGINKGYVNNELVYSTSEFNELYTTATDCRLIYQNEVYVKTIKFVIQEI